MLKSIWAHKTKTISRQKRSTTSAIARGKVAIICLSFTGNVLILV